MVITKLNFMMMIKFITVKMSGISSLMECIYKKKKKKKKKLSISSISLIICNYNYKLNTIIAVKLNEEKCLLLVNVKYIIINTTLNNYL